MLHHELSLITKVHCFGNDITLFFLKINSLNQHFFIKIIFHPRYGDLCCLQRIITADKTLINDLPWPLNSINIIVSHRGTIHCAHLILFTYFETSHMTENMTKTDLDGLFYVWNKDFLILYFFILEASVVGFKPKIAAAPSSP